MVEGPATLVAGAAEHHLRALRLGIGDVLFDLFERRRVVQRALAAAVFQAGAALHLLHRHGALFDESATDTFLHTAAVGTDTSRTRLPVLGTPSTPDRRTETGVR